jgi:RHS repeat-associated protein
VVTATDPNGNKVENRYDGFGGLKTTILPGGRVNQTSIGWVTDNNPPNAIYYTASSGSGAPSSKTYFDALGRELKSETTGFGGEIIYTEKQYYADGLLQKITDPYKSGGTKLWTTYSYDTYKRMSSIVTTICSTSFSYSGTTVTTTDCNGRSSGKTVNGAGDPVTSTDIGGSISYLYHPSGQVRQITAAGSVTSMTYDEYGVQTGLTDPDAGATSYTYNALGELLAQSNARSQTSTMTYDLLGRIATKSNPEGTVTYSYDNAAKGIGMVASVSKSDHTVSYTYDELSRLKTETSTIEGTAYTTSFAYDNYFGKVSQVTYPSQFTVINEYDGCGYLKRVKRGDNNSLIWQGNSVNQYGQLTGATLGNNLTVTHGYDQYGFPSTTQTGTLQNMQFSFNTATGNLTWRKDNLSGRNFTESFTYDNLDRLTNCQIGANNYGTTYQNNGNIVTKHDAGTYTYGTQPHAVTELTGSPMTAAEQTITYSSFSQPVTLTQQAKNLSITYGVDEQRIKSVYTENSVNWTRKYLGDYEEVWVSGQVNKKIHYIAGGDGLTAVFIIKGAGVGELYYVSTDYLGNILLLTRQNGTVAEEYSFDAWGRRRSPTNWNSYTVTAPAILYRGYTGHEHLDEFGLINMNGRCYDPILGRFLSPDNFVQMPDFTQNYNRYAYGLNNPLKYTDPSGNSLIVTLIGLAVNYISQQLFDQPNNSNISDVQQNRSSVIGMGVSAIVNNIIPGANGILKGIFAGGLSGGISGGLAAGIDASFSDGNFGDAFWAGFKSGAITGGAMGGVNGYFTAKAKNLNVWTGTPKRNDYLIMASYNSFGDIDDFSSAYYVVEKGGFSHSFAYFPFEDVLYELGNPSGSASGALSRPFKGLSKEMAYRYFGGDGLKAYQNPKFLEFNGYDRGEFTFYKVNVPDKMKAFKYFESYVGTGKFFYSLPFHNCKSFALTGLARGGSNWAWSQLKLSGPIPALVYGRSSFTYNP